MKIRESIIAVLAAALFSVSVSAQDYPKWLDRSVFYQIYPSSYMDSDGNGIGDIKGITSKLDYIKSIGVTAIWLNPVYESGWMDGGYDVIDYYKVDPRFGTNTDMVELISEAHKRGIKVIMDLVAGHTSDRSAWFLQSMEADPNQRYSDYYIWRKTSLKDTARPILSPAPSESSWRRMPRGRSTTTRTTTRPSRPSITALPIRILPIRGNSLWMHRARGQSGRSFAT